MDQVVKCPPEIFKELEKGCGDWVTLDGDGHTFLYYALEEAFNSPFHPYLCYPYLGYSDWMVVEIESNNKKLFLFYKDDGGWGLGHSDSVLVRKKLPKNPNLK
ncbi:hypothetical protein N9S59_04705 [Pseudomonadota bacterium]|jgi:hypothetical protein|nr:hypothetical protein [Pseudomonadota bacterium]